MPRSIRASTTALLLITVPLGMFLLSNAQARPSDLLYFLLAIAIGIALYTWGSKG